MKSMTGYGRGTAVWAGRTLTVQVSSVNRKSLDLTVKIPEAWETLEPLIGERVRAVASRGKIHVEVELAAATSEGSTPWDEAAVAATLDRLAALAQSRGLPFVATPELLWSIVSSQRSQETLPAAEAVQAPILAALEGALQGFVAMRAREGSALLQDFLARTALLQRSVQIVAERAPGVVSSYREQLFQRLKQAGLELDLGDERVLKEIALFADRCDVTEEITRFRSHLDQFSALLHSDGEMGRKAEFILQEMGRESHTLGSKANDLTISRAVIELKNELERVREQIANVE